VLLLAEQSLDLVRARWARSAELGARRESDGDPILTTDADLSSRRDRIRDALRDDAALAEGVARDLGRGPRIAILADADGVILASRADWREVGRLTRLKLVEGARWCERSRGTNAIGTALAEGRSVGVVGRAHFEARNSELYCYATPIRDAYGDVVAVLDVSGPVEAHDPGVALAVEGAGRRLEQAIIAGEISSSAGAIALIEGLVARSSAPQLLITATGAVRALSVSAARLLGIGGEMASALSCARVFGVGFVELVAGATAQGGARYETARGRFALEVETIAGRGGRPLAALVRFEPSRNTAPTAKSPPSPEPATSTGPFARILGSDPALVRAKVLAARFAATALPVLLLAETGTGKELFARSIHAASARAKGPFVAVNCGALSPSLIASELFGYAPGAFTGASKSGAEGRIQAATGGTLFLDEIAEMPDALQAALLRVLDDGTYQRVGESKDRRADFRLVCATCRDLPAMVEDGRFRVDLFYRIQGASLSIPAIRERSDVVELASLLLASIDDGGGLAIGAEAEDAIREHTWPGNVRELKSAMAHAHALAAGGSVVEREHLPVFRALRTPGREARDAMDGPKTRKDIVLDAVRATLDACGGNVSEAARRLGVGRGTIYRATKTRSG